jgi:O-antigen ligase
LKSIIHILLGGLYFYSLLYLSLTLPFQRFFNPIIGLVGMFLGSLYYWNANRFKRQFKSYKGVLWFALWWVLYGVGVVYSNYSNESAAEAFRVLPVLFIPISIAFGPPLKEKSVQILFRAFVASVIVSLMVSEIYGLFQYFENRDIGNFIPPLNYLYYAKMAQFTGLHTSYYALYTATAFFLLLWDVWFNKNRSFWRYAGLFFLFLMMFIISARTQIAAFILAFTGVIGLEFQRRFGWKRAVFSVTLLFLAFAVTLLVPRRTRERVFELKSYWTSMTDADTEDYRNPRFYIWEKAWQTFLDAPLFGHGTADGLAVFHENIEQDARMLSDNYSIADLEASALNYKNELIRRYKSFEVRDTLSKSFLDGNWLKRGEVELIHSQTAHFDEDNQGAYLAFQQMREGEYYYYQFEVKNRQSGGIYLDHNGRNIAMVREEGAGKGMELFGYLKADGPNLTIGAAEDIDSKIDVENPLLIELDYSPRSNLQPVPAALDNPVEVIVRDFHVHSQFLDFMTRFGLVGLIVLLLTFGRTCYLAWKRSNNLYLILASILFISLLPEHMMSRQAGLFYISFWMPLVFIYGQDFIRRNPNTASASNT